MPRQINLLGIVGEPSQDGSYDIQVKTTDGLPIGTFKIDENGQPIVKDYVEQAKSASKVYVTDSEGGDSVKPLGDFAMTGDIPTDYVAKANAASKVYVTDAEGNDSTKPISDFAMQSDIPVVPTNYSNLAVFIVDCNDGEDDVENVTVQGSISGINVLGDTYKKFGIFYAVPGTSISIGYSAQDDYGCMDHPSNFEAEGYGTSLSVTGTATPGVFLIKLTK